MGNLTIRLALRAGGRIPRIMSAWWPTTILTILFYASLLGEQLIFNLTYVDLYRLAGDDWGLFWASLIWQSRQPSSP
jgi:hypothetical protein